MGLSLQPRQPGRLLAGLHLSDWGPGPCEYLRLVPFWRLMARDALTRGIVVLAAVTLAVAVASCSSLDDPSSTSSESSSEGGTYRVGEAQTQAEYMDRMFDCLRDQGLDVNEEIDPPEVEANGFEDAIAACETLLGPPPAPTPLTEEEITSIFEQLLDAAVCLEATGYDISSPPSLETFIEMYRLSFEGGPMAWDPFSEIQGEVPSCPQPSLN